MPPLCGRMEANMNCYHYIDCLNKAAYELKNVEGNITHLCAECYYKYGSCEVCNNYGVLDSQYGDMTIIEDGSGSAICFTVLNRIKILCNVNKTITSCNGRVQYYENSLYSNQ